MPFQKPPTRGKELIAIGTAVVIIGVVLLLYLVVPGPDTSPIGAPTGEGADVAAPAEVDVPESAKPIPERDSN